VVSGILRARSFHKMGYLLVPSRRHHTGSLTLSNAGGSHHLAGVLIRNAAHPHPLIPTGGCQFPSPEWMPLVCYQATPSLKDRIHHSAPVLVEDPFLHLIQKAPRRRDLRSYLSGHPRIVKPTPDKQTECSTQDRIMVGVVM
jgi:hypothetical protein